MDRVLDPERFRRESEALFYEVRQPEWWQGDALPHPAPYQEPLSRLEAHLRSADFVTTAEIAPPLDASPDRILEKVNAAKRYVSAANFTDNASAAARMSSVAASAICLDAGLEPIVQLQARDRSRVVLASEAIGAAGLGIRNVLCLSGDHQSSGPGPVARAWQFDMDALQILWMLRRMRDDGIYLDGRRIERRPQLYLGAAASPYGTVPRYEALRLEAKINAGAQFVQTQPVFDHPRFLEWMEALDKRRLLDRVHILAGLVPLKSARAASFMANEVSGVHVPEAVTERMQGAGDTDSQRETGVQIALEMIEKLKATPGIRGIHLMPIHWESVIPRLVEEGGLPLPVD
jgi:methylenetetrahydrofolate reductase (NADPH)